MPATEPQDQHPRPVGWKAGASAVGSVRFVLAAEAGRKKKKSQIFFGYWVFMNKPFYPINFIILQRKCF